MKIDLKDLQEHIWQVVKHESDVIDQHFVQWVVHETVAYLLPQIMEAEETVARLAAKTAVEMVLRERTPDGG